MEFSKTARQPTSLEQLQRAFAAGLIDRATFEAARAGIEARLSGGGAINQAPDSTAVGQQSVAVASNNYGDINTGLLIQLGSQAGASKEDLRRAYLARLLNQANQLPLFAADRASAQVKLSSVYTALLTQRSEPDRSIEFSAKPSGATPEHDKKRSALEVLNAEARLVLLGGPGSGKSTFVNFVALCMAGELLGVTAINRKTLTAPINIEGSGDKKPEAQRWDHGALLPVAILLRDFASELPTAATPIGAETLWKHIEKRLQGAAIGDFAPHLRQELLQHGGLILLDGLDEVADPATRREPIKQAVKDFSETFHKCRFLVTSRTYAYTRQDWKLSGFSEAALLSFTREQIQRFVDAW
ncbi:MAG: NACHT domain-containing protein, partial [Methylococcales bacterium]